MDDFVIKVDNVSKFYKLYKSPSERLKEALNPIGKTYHSKFYALKSINLEIKKGEIVGVVGRNGCGKSTLLKLITGILSPNEGDISVSGKISALLELGSGFNPEFTGLQNIYFYGTILGVSKDDISSVVDSVLEFAELGEFINQPVKTYSSGMKSRLGFSVSVHVNPDILILDEVLAVGDDLFRRKCYAKMEELFKNGKTVIYVSHDANSIKHMCSRVIFLDKGELLLDGDPNLVTNSYHKYFLLDQEKQLSYRKKLLSGEVENVEVDIDVDSVLSKSANIINDHLVTFSDLFLSDSNGNKIKDLNLNETYIFNFKTYFKDSLEDVSIGVQMRTIKGVIVSGANMKNCNDQCIEYVKKGDCYFNEMAFECYLLPGSYVVTVFMVDGKGHSSVFYDALLFKVLENRSKQGGLVTLNQNFRVEKYEEKYDG